MIPYKPVSVSKASFAFCRYGIAALVWAAFFFRSPLVLAVVSFLFLLSAIAKVRRAPMIRLYDLLSAGKKNKETVMVDENAIFFAHLMGLALSMLCLSLVIFWDNPAAWYVVLGFALLKTVSAFGFCPASKLYECTTHGNCCVRKKNHGTSFTC